MIIFLKHNVKGNMASADGTGNVEMKDNILVSEVAKLIAVRPGLVVAYLRAAGVKVASRPSKGTLVRLVSKTIPKSPKFAALLAEEIMGMGRAPREHVHGDGDSKGGFDWGSVDWAGMSQQTMDLVKSLGNTFGKGKPKQGAQGQLNQQTNTIKYIAKPMETSTKILIGVAIAVPVIIGGVLLVKHLRG